MNVCYAYVLVVVTVIIYYYYFFLMINLICSLLKAGYISFTSVLPSFIFFSFLYLLTRALNTDECNYMHLIGYLSL